MLCVQTALSRRRATIKTLTPIGNSFGILIDKAILDLLNITKDTPIQITTDGHALVLTPQNASRANRLRPAADAIMDEHDETFRKLAK